MIMKTFLTTLTTAVFLSIQPWMFSQQNRAIDKPAPNTSPSAPNKTPGQPGKATGNPVVDGADFVTTTPELGVPPVVKPRSSSSSSSRYFVAREREDVSP